MSSYFERALSYRFKSKNEKMAESLYDEQIYAKVAEEIFDREISPGLWAKAFAQTNGNEQQAKAIYITLRANQIKLGVDVEAEMVARADQSLKANAGKTAKIPEADTGHGKCTACGSLDIRVGAFQGGRAYCCNRCGQCMY